MREENVLEACGEPRPPAPEPAELAQTAGEEDHGPMDAPACAIGPRIEPVCTALHEDEVPEPCLAIVDASSDRELAAKLALLGLEGSTDPPPCQPSATAEQLSLGADQLSKHAARSLVGRSGVKLAQGELRALMHREAVDRREGSFQAAAGVLDVDRRHVARMADEGSVPT